MPPMYDGESQEERFKSLLEQNERERCARGSIVYTTAAVLQKWVGFNLSPSMGSAGDLEEAIDNAKLAWLDYFDWEVAQSNANIREAQEAQAKYAAPALSTEDLAKACEQRDKLQAEIDKADGLIRHASESGSDNPALSPMVSLCEVAILGPMRSQLEQIEAYITHIQTRLEKYQEPQS